MTLILRLLLISVLAINCNNPADGSISITDTLKRSGAIACPPANDALDIRKIDSIIGMKGVAKNGEYKVTVPQNDLRVIVDGFKIIPAMGLGSWAAFTACADSVMVMGDIIITGQDLKPVQREVIAQGFTITALHNHFVRHQPDIMYMHIDGRGTLKAVSKSVKAIFDRVTQSRGKDPGSVAPDSVANSLNTSSLDSILGYKGEMTRGVYKYTIGRPDVQLQEHGIAVSTFLGFNTWAAWQGTPQHAAVAGDFAMLEDEVAPVIKALVENDIEVVALHNHMIHDSPKIFFLHYWGVGEVAKLAGGLRAALEKTGKKATNK